VKEGSSEDKQHSATEKHRERYEEQGDVLRSKDFSYAFLVLSVFIFLKSYGNYSWDLLKKTMYFYTFHLNDGLNENIFFIFLKNAFYLFVPFFALICCVVSFFSVIQSSKKWYPWSVRLEKWNPISRIQNVFFSKDTFYQLLESFLKFFIVSLACFFYVKNVFIKKIQLFGDSFDERMSLLSSFLVNLIGYVGGAVLCVGVLDYFMVWRKREKRMMMSTQELKEENKEENGDPSIKAKRRRRQIEMARRRSLKAVASADVVVVNPTHYAVALLYRTGKMSAPKVVAKGTDFLAAKIREKARHHGVPVVSEPALARMLYGRVPLGKEIPDDLYQAVAMVLSHVYKYRRRTA
jgi:flagellar biosynthesis protein FlhB